MKLRWTFLAACPLVLAIALFRLHRNQTAVTGTDPRSPSHPAAQAKPFAPTVMGHSKFGNHDATSPDDASAFNERTRSLTPRTPPPAIRELPTPAELERRAQWVERDANHELERLIPLLDLSPDQQDRVFKALAATSPHFVAGMRVDGAVLKTPTGDAQQTVLAQLTDPQASAYLQDASDTSAWWSEYIDHVSSILENGTPALGSGTGTVASTPVITEPVAAVTTEPVIPADTTPATKGANAIIGGE